MLRRYFADHPMTMLRIVSSFYYHHFLKVLLYEHDKADKIRCIGRGLWDWLRGVRGPLR
jgi:hypothetical protein